MALVLAQAATPLGVTFESFLDLMYWSLQSLLPLNVKIHSPHTFLWRTVMKFSLCVAML